MRCPAFDSPGTSARRFRGFFVLLLCSLSVLQPTLFWTLRSFRCCLLLSSAPPRSPRECPCRTGPLYVPSWVPSFCPPPIPGSRPWHPAAAQPTLFWTLRSFRCCLPPLFCPPRPPRVFPGPVGPPVCPAMGTLLLLFPDSRFPSVVPGCGAAYSLLGSSLLPALSAYSLKPLLALPGCAPAGRAPCMPPAFSRFQAPARDTRPRHPAAALSHRARVPILAPPCPCPCVLFFSRFSARNVVYLTF